MVKAGRYQIVCVEIMTMTARIQRLVKIMVAAVQRSSRKLAWVGEQLSLAGVIVPRSKTLPLNMMVVPFVNVMVALLIMFSSFVGQADVSSADRADGRKLEGGWIMSRLRIVLVTSSIKNTKGQNLVSSSFLSCSAEVMLVVVVVVVTATLGS